GLDGVLRGTLHRGRVADVGDVDGDGVARQRLQVCAGGEGVVDTGQAVGVTEAAVERDDAHPALGEGAHGRGADPAGGAGHEGDPVVGQRGTPSVRVKPSGTRTSSRVRSWIEEWPIPSSAESMPPRRMSSTFSTPAWPLAASPHR